MTQMRRRYWMLLGLLVICLAGLALLWVCGIPSTSKDPIRVGILHSFSGTMSVSETPVAQATQMAVDEINEAGGVLGRRVEAIVVDGKSDPSEFARQAKRLIEGEGVSVIFGCWTSISRKAVKPVVEKRDHLLFYPVQYEGLESSPNIIYTGAAPNQQIVPAAKWALDNIGRRFFLVGSDYVFPRAANAIIKDYLEIWGGDIVGEEYRPLGSSDFLGMAKQIARIKPDIIINTINGESSLAFFDALHGAKILSSDIPVMSLSLAEEELHHMKRMLLQSHPDEYEHIIEKHFVGNYSAWNYFESIDSERNRSFVEEFKERYGADSVTDDPMEAAYFGVHIWAQAVAEAGTDDVGEVLRALKGQSYDAPEGVVSIDWHNNHTWKLVRIGKVRDDLQFEILWSSGRAIRPVPYPRTRSRSQWDSFVDSLLNGDEGEFTIDAKTNGGIGVNN